MVLDKGIALGHDRYVIDRQMVAADRMWVQYWIVLSFFQDYQSQTPQFSLAPSNAKPASKAEIIRRPRERVTE